MLNLTKFVEEDEGEDELESRKNQRRSEWAKGKLTRTQPSENWDDDFLFGSVSVESLPLPTTKNNEDNKKPGSAQSSINNPSRSYPRTNRHPQRKNTDPDPTLVLQPSQDSLTPRKTRPQPTLNTTIKTLTTPTPPSITTTIITTIDPFNTSRSSPARSRPALSRPPASAPPSRGQSVDAMSSIIKPTHQTRVSHHHHTPYDPKAISSQNSVPSISDLSSIGFRSPSSSLSMTDDSRGDWSHSSGDHSAQFRGTESGNLSFNTETEFTEPDLELDWTPDELEPKDHQKNSNFLHKPQQPTQPSYNRPSSSSSSTNPHLAHHQYYPPISTSLSSSTDQHHHLNSHSNSSSPKQIDHLFQPRKQSTHTTNILSQSTSIQTSRSKKTFLNNNNPSILSPSATSSSSSIGYYKSNCSDVSLNSPTAVYSNVHSNLIDSRHPRQPPLRTSSCSSSCSVNLGYCHSGSESYDPATSGTETDGVSDQLYQSISSPSSSDPNRNTPTVSQRSRKQALYSRPPYVSPSPGSSLSGSISTSTLNASEASLDSRIAGLSLSNTGLNSQPHTMAATEDERSTAKNPSRRRFRKKRPSTLLLNKAAGLFNGPVDSSAVRRSPTSALSHKASTVDSVYPTECPRPGDLAFAADSDDEERRQSRSNHGHHQLHLAESRKRTDPLPSRTPPRVPLSGYHGLNTRSRSTINRSHTSMQGRNENKQCLSPPDTTSDDSSGKILKPKRPLSFTALFSRGSANNSCPPPPNPPPIKTSNPNQLSRSCFGHRYSTSIDSTTHRLGSSPNSHTSNDSILSRVRRLSSRPALLKHSSPISPTRKRFSLAGDTSSRHSIQSGPSVSSGKVMTTPLKAFKAANDKFSTALKSNRRQTSQSDSFVSDVTLTAVDSYGTVRARRPSSRASCSNSSIISSTQPSLARKFSIRSNNKSSINEPDLCHLPADSRIDHNLASASQSRFPARRTLASKPPKSNPALRARAEANAQFQGYQINPDYASQSLHSQPEPTDSQSPPSDSIDISPTSSAWGARYPYRRDLSNHLVPNSEPLPTPFSDGEHDTHVSNHLAHIGNLPNPTSLTRSNSMGELRIPSRITSQQGRLQTELNQVKEFARGIEELKSMRRTYRKMIRATHRSRVNRSFANTDESDGNSSDSDSQKEPERLPDRPHQEEIERPVENPNQVSPRALSRLYTVIQKIQEEYKEWWTCCNVLIDLGEGSTDPRTKFSTERVRAITSYSQGPLEHTLEPPPPTVGVTSPEAAPGAQKHFEILKSMFAPDGSEATPPPTSTSSEQTSPESCGSGPCPELRCQTPPMAKQHEIDSGDKTPISRPAPTDDEPPPAHQPLTPTPVPRKVHSTELATTTIRTMEESQTAGGRLSDWSEIDAAWSDSLLVDRLVPKSAPAISRERSSSKLDRPELPPALKDKRKAHSGRYSSYQNHQQPSLALGLLSQRLGAGSRIGISGIKDFLRVLKARVHAEEKWPMKRTVVGGGPGQSSLTAALGNGEGDGSLKPRSVSSSLRAQKAAQKAQIKKAGNQPRSVTKSKDETYDASSQTGGDDDRNDVDRSATDQAADHAESVSSSEEECWDELFGFNQNNTTTITSESLDLALPTQLLHSNLASKKKNGPIHPFNAAAGTSEPRLALSSDRMPQLLSYLNVVKDMCAGCLDELKSQTV